MKNRKFKLFDDKKIIKELSSSEEMNRLRKETLLENMIPIISGIGSICFSRMAFNLDQPYAYMKNPLLIGSIALGAIGVGTIIGLNLTEGSKQRREKIKQLKLKQKELKEKFKTLDNEPIKKR